MRSEIAAWQEQHNIRGAPITWRFTTDDAGIKLTLLYQKF